MSNAKAARAYKTMPKTVRVGANSYKIELIQRDDSDVAGIFGYAHHVDAKIGIRVGLNCQQLANTFLHEVRHAIHWSYGLTDESCEESFTDLGTNGLCAFFRDNPQAIAWIIKTNAEVENV